MIYKAVAMTLGHDGRDLIQIVPLEIVVLVKTVVHSGGKTFYLVRNNGRVAGCTWGMDPDEGFAGRFAEID